MLSVQEIHFYNNLVESNKSHNLIVCPFVKEDIVVTKNGEKIPRIETKTVWLVNIRFPKQLLNVSEDIKDIDDIDFDSVESAYDEELDG